MEVNILTFIFPEIQDNFVQQTHLRNHSNQFIIKNRMQEW